MQIVPLISVPQQTLTIALGGLNCRIRLRTKTIGQGVDVTNLFCDIYAGITLLVGGVICQNYNLIVRDAYRGFPGDLSFWDTLGTDDPIWTGLGTRFVLIYYQPSDFP